MSKKQELFVQYYLQNFNATRAARMAGYSDNGGYLHTVASKLLQNSTIKAEIDERMKQAKLSADAVIKLLSDHATGTLEDFLNSDGEIDLETARQSGLMHLLKEVEITETYNKDDSGSVRRKIKLHDPQKALELLGRYYVLFTDKQQVTEHKTIHVTMAKQDD